jgi:hypothetical protein
VTEARIGVCERGRKHDEDFKVKKLKYFTADQFIEVFERKKLS